jgi:hypothetical protein
MSIQSIDIDWADSSFDAIKILQDMILQKSQPKINNKYKIPLDLIRNAVVISAGICIPQTHLAHTGPCLPRVGLCLRGGAF